MASVLQGNLRELGLFRLEERQQRGQLINAHEQLQGGCCEDGARMLNSGMRYQKHWKFHLDMKNFTAWMSGTGCTEIFPWPWTR